MKNLKIEATPEVLISEVFAIFYISCFSFKHIGLWETVSPPIAVYMMIFSQISKGNRVIGFMKDLNAVQGTRTKSFRELFQLLIVLSFFNRYKGATAYPISNAGMLQL